jgi:hypothetical protein
VVGIDVMQIRLERIRLRGNLVRSAASTDAGRIKELAIVRQCKRSEYALLLSVGQDSLCG